MTAIASPPLSFLSWPRAIETWEQGLRWLMPQAEELWSRVQLARTRSDGTQVLTVAGISDGDGASMTAAALAYYAGNALSLRVLLVEADLRHPSLQARGLSPRCPGLAGMLMRQVSIKHVIFNLTRVGFWVLPAGNELATPTVHVHPEQIERLLDTVRPWFDVVILDSPPLSSSPEARALVVSANATVPVLRSGRSLPEQAAYWIGKIGEYGGRVGAVCLNAVETPLPDRIRSLL